MDTPVIQPNHPWGAKVNTSHFIADHTTDWPAWADKHQQEQWNVCGLVVWDHASHTLIGLQFRYALTLLDYLRQTTTWQQSGLIIGTPAFVIPHLRKHQDLTNLTFSEIPFQPLGHCEPGSVQAVLMDHLPLIPAQIRHVLRLLETHEADLRRLEETFWHDLSDRGYPIHLRLLRTTALQTAKQVDLTTRSLSWQPHDEQPIWTCELPPNRGTVMLVDGTMYWRGRLERPHKLIRDSLAHSSFEAALTWTEQQLMEAAAQAMAEADKPSPPAPLSLATLRAAHRKRLRRFWIDPWTLEPARVIYNVSIFVQHAPVRYEVLELSFGEKLLCDEQYPMPRELARKLSLDNAPVNVDGDWRFDEYRITSLATYADERTACEQAQQLLDRSGIGTGFQSNKITAAHYSIVECETGYTQVLGWLGKPLVALVTRDSYMAEQAFQLTLIHALDVEGYTAANPRDVKGLSREEVLEYLHFLRHCSRQLPAGVRAESEQWLRAQGHANLDKYIPPTLRKMEAAREQRAQQAAAERKQRRRQKTSTPQSTVTTDNRRHK